jgi:hypothetical protein
MDYRKGLTKMDFNLDDLFAKMEADSKFESVLYFPKKGDNCLLALLPPMEHDGEHKLALVVEGDFKGKKTKQFILRCIKWSIVGGKVDSANPQYVGIVLSPTYVQQIANAKSKEFQLATQECHFIELAKSEKTILTFRPTIKKIPDEIWNAGLEKPTWAELLKANEDAKQAFAKKSDGKDTKAETSPWDE